MPNINFQIQPDKHTHFRFTYLNIDVTDDEKSDLKQYFKKVATFGVRIGIRFRLGVGFQGFKLFID